MKISKIDTPQCMVGEGPVWDVQDQALYYVDIIGKKVSRFTPETGKTDSWELPGVIGSMALREQGGAIVALADGVYTLDFETGKSKLIAQPENLDPAVQFNDGKVDRHGRFVVGTTDSTLKAPIGTVFSLDENHELTELDSDITISNGPCWSPDNKTFYFADSLRFSIYAYDYDIETGKVSNRRELANTKEQGGIPDGATVDEDGTIWSAICEGGKVVGYNPDGSINRIIEMPVALTSSVIFGGSNLDKMYVTSINPEDINKSLGLDKALEADGGRIFVVEDLGVRGIAEPRYKG